jgi:hypothetical protein
MRGNEISFKSQVEAALRACGGANLFGQVTDQFVAQRSVGGVIPPVLNRDQQRPPGRGNQPTPPSDEIDIAGIVTVDDGYPRPSFKFSMADAMGRSFSPDVVPRNSSGPAGTFDRAPTTVVIHPPEFTIGLPPGEYRPVVTGLPGGYVVKSIRSGAIDLLKEGFRITNGSQPAPITIALGVNSGPPWVAVSGRVVNASNRGTVDGRGARRGEAPADSIMLVGFAFSEILLAPLGTGGAFEFPRVLPGTYIVRVLPDIPETYASQFRDASSTYEVVVGADGARNIEVVAPAVVTGVMIIRN